MLVKHAQMAQSMGIPPENTVIVRNGDMVELSGDRIAIVSQVPSGLQLVDSAGVVHDNIMQERQQLAEDGVVTVAAAIDWDGKLMAQPEVHLRGVVTTVERSLLQQLIVKTIERILSERWSEFSQSANGDSIEVDWASLREGIENNLQRLVRRELQSSPLVVFLLQTPDPTPTRTYRRRRSTASVASSEQSLSPISN